MDKIKLSVIIPCYKDPYLQNTIDAILRHPRLGNQIEVIPVLDGYWPDQPLKDDDRVRVLHLGTRVGPKNAIMAGIAMSRGEFIMRTDAHCDFAPGFAKELTDTCEPNWIITGYRYFLDPKTWTNLDRDPVYYEKLVVQTIQDKKKFTGYPWRERDEERKDIMIDETMAMQGSVWIMPRKWWDTLGGFDEGFGPHYQDQHELIFKTWKNGGKMMLNKNTWYSHRGNQFPRTHHITHDSEKENMFKFYEHWKDYYEKEIKPAWKI